MKAISSGVSSPGGPNQRRPSGAIDVRPTFGGPPESVGRRRRWDRDGRCARQHRSYDLVPDLEPLAPEVALVRPELLADQLDGCRNQKTMFVSLLTSR